MVNLSANRLLTSSYGVEPPHELYSQSKNSGIHVCHRDKTGYKLPDAPKRSIIWQGNSVGSAGRTLRSVYRDISHKVAEQLRKYIMMFWQSHTTFKLSVHRRPHIKLRHLKFSLNCNHAHIGWIIPQQCERTRQQGLECNAVLGWTDFVVICSFEYMWQMETMLTVHNSSIHNTADNKFNLLTKVIYRREECDTVYVKACIVSRDCTCTSRDYIIMVKIICFVSDFPKQNTSKKDRKSSKHNNAIITPPVPLPSSKQNRRPFSPPCYEVPLRSGSKKLYGVIPRLSRITKKPNASITSSSCFRGLWTSPCGAAKFDERQ